MSTDDRAEPTPYERFGGHDFFVDLVADFYRQVADDPVLRPLYPEEDLGPAEVRLRMFFEQYWGGPTTYSDERGHPFAIDEQARDLWLAHMRTALDNRDLPPDLDDEMWRYLVMAAHAMVNVHDDQRPAKPNLPTT